MSKLDQAITMFNEGFKTKAEKNKALKLLNSVYEMKKDEIRLIDYDCYFEMPIELHHWRPKHSEMLSAHKKQVDSIKALLALRTAIKSEEIKTIVKQESKEEIVKNSILAEMEKRKARFVEGLELAKLFGGLQVSVNSHYVINEHGTKFIRNFFYLNGKLTALGTIIAIAEELEK